MRKVIPILAMMILATTMSLAQLANSAWPIRGHDLQHTGRSPYVGPDTPLKTWEFTTGNAVESSPAIGEDGTIYFGSWDKNVYAVKPDGNKKWAFTAGKFVASSPAIGADGTIYVGSGDKNVYAIKPDGTQKWAFTTGAQVHSTPTIGTDGTIYVGSYDNNVYAIKSDGTQKWVFTTGSYVSASPAIGVDGTIYIGSTDNKIYAIKSDGTLKWAFIIGGWVYSTPAIGKDGTIYVGCYDNKLYAIKPDGTLKWTFTAGSYVNSSPTIGTDDTIYVGSADNKLYAIKPDGTQKWAFTTGNAVYSSPAIDADGIIYFGSSDTKLYAIKSDGALKWTFSAKGTINTSPAITADGTIYVGTNAGILYAIGAGGNAQTLTITPTTATLNKGATQQFTATPSTGVTWTATGGTISNTGLYTAGNTAGNYIVTATSANGTATANVTINIAIQPLAAPNLVSPANNAINVTLPVTLSWDIVSSATTYSLQLATNSTFTTGLIDRINLTATTQTETLSNDTKYYWRVRAGKGASWSSWSTTNNFTTTTGNQQNLTITPATCTLNTGATQQFTATPATGVTWTTTGGTISNTGLYTAGNTAGNYIVTATSANGTATANIIINAVQTLTITPTTATLNTGATQQFTATPATGITWSATGGTISNTGVYTAGNTTGTYIVTARSANGTATASVTINRTALTAPILLSPANSGLNISTSTSFAWQPVANAVNYTLQYALNSAFTNAITINSTVTTANATLMPGNRYYWRVKAADGNNIESGWSAVWSFSTVNQTVQINAPTLITPADGAIDVPIATVFSWSSVANALGYDIELSLKSDFATRVVLTTALTTLKTTLAYNTVYYWRVRGKNGNNLGIWSTTGTFTTGAFVPTAGIDAAIANSKVGSSIMGLGVVNSDGTLQTITIDHPINRQTEFNILVKNTGNVADRFLVSSISSVNKKWKVTVYDISGIDITRKIFNGGATTYSVKPGASAILRLRFAAASGQVIDPANPPTQSITITAQSWNDINNGVATPASDTVVATVVLVKMAK